MGGLDMTKKEKIKTLYYEERLNIVIISEKLHISKQYVSKVIRNDTRYELEKTRRKDENAIKQKQRNIQCIINKRKRIKAEQIDAYVEMQHFQATSELSGRRTINNRAFRNWNPSIYQFHNRSKEYRVKQDFKDKVSYAVPKKVKWK